MRLPLTVSAVVLSALLLVGAGPDLVIVDPGGKPIEGAKVVGASFSISGQTTFSDKRGHASIPSTVQPTKWVSVYKDGFTPVEHIGIDKKKPIVISMTKTNG